MAYIKNIKGKFKVEIKKKGFPRFSRTFITIKDAKRFEKDTESKMERNVFEDYTSASRTSLKEILIKYRDEKTVLKKGHKEETSTINFLIRHPISFNSLMRLRSHHIYKLMKELGETRAAATVNKYINLICEVWSNY
jgi:hypothetical protein|tara:strand:- start:27 stop:437 length:411 start_codon:yes stop_codon:yes gene_type:complete